MNTPQIKALSEYLSEAVYEVITTQDNLNKYERLLERYAQQAGVDYPTLKKDLSDFLVLFEQTAGDFTISNFEEKSLLAQGHLAYIQEETILKLIDFVKTATKQKNQFPHHEVRVPLIEEQKQPVTLLSFTKPDQNFIHEGDILLYLQADEKKYPVHSPYSGRIHYKQGVGNSLSFGTTLCEIAEEKRTGKFEYYWQEGRRYIGDFIEGAMTGRGIIDYPNGDKYTGDLLDGHRHGRGRIEYANGNQYDGQWHLDEKVGEGTFSIQKMEDFILFETYTVQSGNATFQLANGDQAMGNFHEGKLNPNYHHGYLFQNGNAYSGQFQNGKFEGQGQLLYHADQAPQMMGKVLKNIVGSFAEGQAHGPVVATLVQKNREVHIETMAIHGKLLLEIVPYARQYEGKLEKGEGKIWVQRFDKDEIYRDEPEPVLHYFDLSERKTYATYEGQFENYTIQGKGLFKSSSFSYEGEFEQGKLHGEGTLKKGSRFWQGSFVHNQLRLGKAYENRNQLAYEGEFKDFFVSDDYMNKPKSLHRGEYHGQGKRMMGENHYWEGQFIDGVFVQGEGHFETELRLPFYAKTLGVYTGNIQGDTHISRKDKKAGHIPISGSGLFTCPEGKAEGNFVENQFKEGQVSLNVNILLLSKHEVSGQIEGQVKDGKLSKGVFTWPKGKAEGDFQENRLVQGRIRIELSLEVPPFCRNETGIYEGEMSQGNINGNGTFTWSNGKFSGHFQNGQIQQGTFISEGKSASSKPGMSYEGAFKNAKMHGLGKATYHNGVSYEGAWQDGEPHGEGKKIFENGEIYEGQFQNNQLYGFGKLTQQNGDVYEGHFVANVFNGQGSLQSSNGDRYEGQWKAGKRDGEGTQILYAQNKTLTGLWSEDKLIKDYNKKGLWQRFFGKG